MKRNLLFALLLALAGTLVFHERLATGVDVVHQWWQLRQQRSYNHALQEYRLRLGDAVAAQARTPHDHAIAALLYPTGEFHLPDGHPAPAADEAEQAERTDWRRRAQAQWDMAIVAADPMTLWLAVADCPVQRCDAAAALTRLRNEQPDNAAVGLLELDAALKQGDAGRAQRAFDDLAGATYYRDYLGDLMRGLLHGYDSVPVPRQLLVGQSPGIGETPAGAAAMFAVGQWIAVGLPGFAGFMDHCKPGARPESDPRRPTCLAIARLLADSDTALARSSGLRVWYRYVHADAGGAVVRQRMRDYRWLAEQFGKSEIFDNDVGLLRWKREWLAGGGELQVAARLMQQQGIPLTAPVDFQAGEGYFDPDR
jgi:hypothetical protein